MSEDVQKLKIDCDLTFESFATACGALAVLPEATTLVCAFEYAALAQRIRDQYRCSVVFVPKDILLGSGQSWGGMDTWCVVSGHRAVWSPGT